MRTVKPFFLQKVSYLVLKVARFFLILVRIYLPTPLPQPLSIPQDS